MQTCFESHRYLRADTVSQKYNITWAGSTMGTDQFTSDGRLYNEPSVVTIPCDTTAQTCNVPVYSPSIALVFLNDEALTNSGGAAGDDGSGSILSFATTISTAGKATVDYASVAVSNGRSGQDPLGSTSKGSNSNGGEHVIHELHYGIFLLAFLYAAYVIL